MDNHVYLSCFFLFLQTKANYLKDKDKEPFIGLQEFVVGYSKAPEQPQSSARPVCHSHAMTSTGREPATIRNAAYRSSPCYALRAGDGRNAVSQDSVVALGKSYGIKQIENINKSTL